MSPGPKKKIRLLKSYDRFKKGEVIEHHEFVADLWAKRGICEIVGAAEPAKVEQAPAGK